MANTSVSSHFLPIQRYHLRTYPFSEVTLCLDFERSSLHLCFNVFPRDIPGDCYLYGKYLFVIFYYLKAITTEGTRNPEFAGSARI